MVDGSETGFLPTGLLYGKEHVLHVNKDLSPCQQGECELQLRLFIRFGLETTSYYSEPVYKLPKGMQTGIYTINGVQHPPPPPLPPYNALQCSVPFC